MTLDGIHQHFPPKHKRPVMLTVATLPLARRHALHYAAAASDVALCEVLLRRGAAVDCTTKKRVSPLQLACTTGDMDTVLMLIRAGAK